MQIEIQIEIETKNNQIVYHIYIYIYIYIYCKSIIVAPIQGLESTCYPNQLPGITFTFSKALAGSGEPTGRRLGGIAVLSHFAYVWAWPPFQCSEPGSSFSRLADFAYPRTFCHRWHSDFCAVRGWKTRLSALQVGSPLPVWVKAHSHW